MSHELKKAGKGLFSLQLFLHDIGPGVKVTVNLVVNLFQRYIFQ